MDSQPSIHYSDVFAAAVGQRPPQGDKMLLPPSALQALLDAAAQAQQQALPQPLTFRLVNTANQRAVFAGIREFSADEGEVVLSAYLRAALGLACADDGAGDDGAANDGAGPRIAVAFAPLPKGTFVLLRPLEAGYNPADWRALLERQLREGFTTLTRDALLAVRGSAAGETFRLRVDGFRPEGHDGVCVVDTDLEVDIEALDEAQARETVRQIQAQSGGGGGDDDDGSTTSRGGKLDIFRPVHGRVLAGEHVDYELPAWDRSRPLAISLSGLHGDEDEEPGYAVDLLVSPRSARQRAPPRETEHVWADRGLADATGCKTLTLAPTDGALDEAEALLVTVHGWRQASAAAAHAYTLRARTVLEEEEGGGAAATASHDGHEDDDSHDDDDEQCQNCLQWVPGRTMVLHESFCRRNNAACRQCRQVFVARSAAWQNHWHCVEDPADGGGGNTAASRAKHAALFHTRQTCPAATCRRAFASTAALARHRTTTCPAKLILCQFCRLDVAQEGDPDDPAVEAATALTGMTPHERADGARTTECYLCDAIVRLRDMRAHLQHHALDRQRRPPPPLCRNAECARTRHGVGPRGQIRPPPDSSNPLGLCAACFAPLYVSTHDPDGRVLRRRLERRYLAQLLTGCGRPGCANPWCRTGRQNQALGPFDGGGGGAAAAATAAAAAAGAPTAAAAGGTAALLPLVRPLVAAAAADDDAARPMHLCVDEPAQQRRAVAAMLAAQHRYAPAWCMAACEAEGPDASRAWSWLSSWAPEVRRTVADEAKLEAAEAGRFPNA